MHDYDDIGKDDFIGETEIDVESRYFDEKWMSSENYPIEKRALKRPECEVATGSIRMWVEVVIDDANLADKALNQSSQSESLASMNSRGNYEKLSIDRPLWIISMMPPGDFELRVIVWEVQNCPIDDPEGLTDIYVTGALPSLDNKTIMRTDTHVRSEGFGSFNWRMKFLIKSEAYLDRNKYKLNLEIWDKDLLSANDYIASRSLDVWPAINACMNTGTKAILKSKGDEKLELECQTLRKLNKGKKPTILITVECLTKHE